MKTFFGSKTVWFGIGQVVFAAIGYLTGWIDSDAAYALLVTGVGSIGLRLNTSKPIVKL